MQIARAGVAVIALVAAVVGAYAVFRAWDERSAPPIIISDSLAMQPVVIDLRGAVNRPGVYELPPGARVQDAVDAGGGLRDDADLSTINLARRLRDGEAVTIATVPQPGATTLPAPPPTSELAPEAAIIRVNLNTATASELTALPGIGQVLADRIVTFREEHGPFRAIDDLVHVEGVSSRTITGLRELVTIGP